ncbi:hypothetical protein Trydic_g7522 [Trypoxylus dichotomus]
MDVIFPALLQQGLHLLSAVLCTLLRATLAVGHLLNSYREARVIFIPKQSKTSCTKPNRPVILALFLLKTLEKIINRHLRDLALDRLPLHENQYAYQSGKSYEQVIHELARGAEIAIGHKEIALTTFLDIESAGRPSCQWSELCKDVESSQRLPSGSPPCCGRAMCNHLCSGACWLTSCCPSLGGGFLGAGLRR